jgi:RNA polymerase sigma factor (sigma-70 family)
MAGIDMADDAERNGRTTTVTPADERVIAAHIEDTLCFVPTLARRYAGRGVPMDELVAAGNLGLVEAALRFDPTRNVRFMTYASWWIRKAILEALGHQSGPMRLPRYQYDKLKSLRDARSRWSARSGGAPSREQAAEEAGLSPEEVHELDLLVTRSVSLEQPVGDGETRSLKELLEDPDAADPDRTLQLRDLTRRLRRRVSELSARERQVVSLRFGLGDGVARTLRETGRELGISRERVRQVELRALRKLRSVL